MWRTGSASRTGSSNPSRRGRSDADMLAGLTHVAGGIWAALFWLVGGVAVVTTAWVLLF